MLAALFLSYAAPEAGPCGRSIGNVCSASIADRNRWSAACLSPMTRKPTSRGSTAQAMASFRSEEHTSELQSLMRISYAVFCLEQKKHKHLNYNPSTYQI